MNKQPNKLEAEMRVKKWFGKEESFKEARKAAIEVFLKIKKEFDGGDYWSRLAIYDKKEQARKQVIQYDKDYEDLRLLERI